jgi:4a-hydroxytetrahydrobiopterin dehydratase
MELAKRTCVPCTGDATRLTPDAAAALHREIPEWELAADRIARSFEFRDFAEAMTFVNAVAEVAESEGHHPDFCVHWNRVDISIWTHAAGGLTENDFILAAKIDREERGGNRGEGRGARGE